MSRKHLASKLLQEISLIFGIATKKSICLPYNKYHFADLEEPHPIPLPVINAANDQNEGQQEDESHEEGEPKENNSGLADAIETQVQNVPTPTPNNH